MSGKEGILRYLLAGIAMVLTAPAQADSLKAARTALSGKSPDSKATVHEAIRTLDRAVTRGVMHRNTAARKKSALARSLNTLA